MITPLLRSALDPIVQRQRYVRNLQTGTLCALIGAAVCAGLWVSHQHFGWTALVILGVLVIRASLRRRSEAAEPDFTELARLIETRHPQLHALLLTAVEQQPDPTTRKLTYLQQKVIADAVTASRKMDFVSAVPSFRLWSAQIMNLAAWVVMGWVLYQFGLSGLRRPAPEKLAQSAAQEGVTVTPGDASLERGSGLVVLADFHRHVPSEATLVIQPKNQPPQRIALVKNLDDPVFGGGLPEVDGDMTYRVEYAGQATRDFSVKVFEHPRLDRADATLHFPEYTKQPEKKIPDTRWVSAVEGSKLDVAFLLNKPVKSATLVAKDGSKVPLDVSTDQNAATLNGFTVNASQTYELKLEDADGRANKLPAQFIVDAVANRRPELKYQTPKGDQRVSSIEEVAFRADAWDDFGLARYGLTINVAGRGEQQIELGTGTKADEKKEISHLLKLEELGVKPDELVSWFLWAEDVGPDGQPRRTETDIYFAEVRPFEEIYRRGDDSEGGGGGGGGGGEQAMKTAELQKQIVSATWNLKRAEEANTTAQKPGAKYLEGAPVLHDSQEEALNKANEMAAKIEDPKVKALADNATKQMQKALDHLAKAKDTPAPLPEALSAEQAAYDALLKLAAHEFRVKQSKGKGKGGGQERQQQQLDELDMKDEKQRYETKREAESPQNEQQREELAILNRLKELAQRQQDINERIKELQTALQAANTEAEKEEIRRQLKRLREEEQQLLADLDETRQKMEQSPQQAQLANERQQLDKTRAEAQKAAESMEKGETSQALASGTRTQRDLQQMRDDFRKKTSGQFKDQMRQMRADARDLAEKQQEIGEKLKGEPNKQERKTLDGSSPREQLAQQFTRQQDNLNKITEQMKEVSEQAEAAEPLLAKELYDTLRKTTQASTSETLSKAQMLAQRGYAPQAQKFEEKVRGEIEELKTGVERAAESVLGDEAEALRQARAELDALKNQLEKEIARARPDLADNNSSATGQKPGSEQGTDKEGKTPDDQPGQQPGERGQSGDGKQESGKQPGDSAKTAMTGQDGQKPGEQPGTQNGEQAGKGQSDKGEQPGENGQDGKEAQQGRGRTAQQKPGEGPGQDQTPGEGKQPGQGEGQGQQPGQSSQPGNQMAQDSEGQGKGQGRGQGQGQEQELGRAQANAQGQGKGQGKGEGQGQGEGQTQAQAQAQAQGEGQGKGQGQGQGEGQGKGQGRGQTANAANGQGLGNGTAEPKDEQGGDRNGQRTAQRLSQMSSGPKERGGIRSGADNGGGQWGGGVEGEEQGGPLTGEKFTEWSDRLRNVEEMVDDPAMRTEIARVRELAKGVRVEFKRHSLAPNWDMVKDKIGTPLAELRNRLTEELARRESKENLVPIDRDPVPTKYAERVRRYYEELGRSR